MPELPEVEAYLHGLRQLVVGHRLERIRIRSVSLLRTVDPPVAAAEGRSVEGVSRLGKRLVWHLEGDLHLVIHLMIAGRLRWRPPGAALSGRAAAAAFDLPHGTVLLTEQASHKRASLHVVAGVDALEAFRPAGVEPLEVDLATFAAALRRENRTLKRALTDPRIVSGIGNAHSDEILWEAQLSPVTWTSRLTDEELARLYDATVRSLTAWVERLREEAAEGLPERVTAFHPAMAVHGRYGQPCRRCGAPIQRIRYADNETDYCPGCQTGGRILADRSLSRLLRDDWPRTLAELEELTGR